MFRNVRHRIALTGTGLGMLAASLALPMTGMAHDSHDQEYGAWVHTGTCDKLSSTPIEELGDLEIEKSARRDLRLAPPTPDQIYMENEEIAPSVDDLTGSAHAVVVRQSDEITSNIVACGEITGKADSNGVLKVTLYTVNDSGMMGQAQIEPSGDNDPDEQTRITVGVWKGSNPSPVASPAV